jgi:hypothetical protein
MTIAIIEEEAWFSNILKSLIKGLETGNDNLVLMEVSSQ